MKKTVAAFAALMIAIAPLAAQTPPSFLEQQTQVEVLGTDFIGTPVVNKAGEKVGSVANLVFDQTGHIELVVIGVGGFLGVGQKEVAVLFETVKSDTQNNKHVWVIDATKDQLKAAPSYKTLNDQALQQRMAEWRAKASESWKQVKEKAGQAYEGAKERVNEARKPSDAPVQK